MKFLGFIILFGFFANVSFAASKKSPDRGVANADQFSIESFIRDSGGPSDDPISQGNGNRHG